MQNTDTGKWREIPAPARKAEYVNKLLLLKEDPPRQDLLRAFWPDGYAWNPDLTGQVVSVERRVNAKDTECSPISVSHWGSVRALLLSCGCPHCGLSRRFYIREDWIAEGKAVFVERAE